MTQPPGPVGGPYGPSGPFDPYGRPLPPPPPYGQQPSGYGQPWQYGPPPQPPRKPNLLPWLIVGGAVLFSGLGILLVVLLRGEDTTAPQNAASPSIPAASSSSAGASASGSVHADLPGGAQVADGETGSAQGRYEGSAGVALAWVEGMAQGDFQTAFDLSCADVQASATEAAAGEDPAWTLGTYFFEQTLGGQGFTDGSFDSINYDEASDSDIASFTLNLDDGSEFLLLVYVLPEGTVCDFR
jgi:hypothetical protein